MENKRFKHTPYDLAELLSNIQRGGIALPHIQRRFVWTKAQVRDLIDSMYKGFPIGNLLLWETTASPRSREIGVEKKRNTPSRLIIDGQQRLTSLYSVVMGQPIIQKDYSKGRIRIAFKPSDQSFAVANAATGKDPEFISDISDVFREDIYRAFVRDFLAKLKKHRGCRMEEKERDRLEDNIDKVKNLKGYEFQVIEISTSVPEEVVADIFVRINNKGVKLSNIDFVLTLMSVFWEEGRKDLEKFCRLGKEAEYDRKNSPFNHLVKPDPNQLLKVSIGLAFRRAQMRSIYLILQGKNPETRKFSSDFRDEQFKKMEESQRLVLNLSNWHEYLRCLQVAGFRSERMVSSETALMYVYILWLLGKHFFGVDIRRLRNVIARWWFMAHTTSRYSGAVETQMQQDLDRMETLLETEDAKADKFCESLDQIIRGEFTGDYWEINLPRDFTLPARKSPALSAYWAALNILDAEVLFSHNMKVSQILDPVITPVKDIERHHLFPRAYLKRKGITGKQVDAIANMAFVDWNDNLKISDKDPEDYWPTMIKSMPPEQLKQQMGWHALPDDWWREEYSRFCEKRSRLIADIVRKGFEKLTSGDAV